MTLPLEECYRGCYPSYFDFKIEISELREIIGSLKHKSSPGLDLINNTILKLIPVTGLEYFLTIFEQILKGSYYPESWKKFIVILLQKSAREDFRPIFSSLFIKSIRENSQEKTRKI